MARRAIPTRRLKLISQFTLFRTSLPLSQGFPGCTLLGEWCNILSFHLPLQGASGVIRPASADQCAPRRRTMNSHSPAPRLENIMIRFHNLARVIIPEITFCCWLVLSSSITTHASPAGDACRKEICEATEAACMQTNQSLNPLASTESEKKTYCAQFFSGCMTRSVVPDVAWYSPETVDRLLKCPS
jgi:hypothetical protein